MHVLLLFDKSFSHLLIRYYIGVFAHRNVAIIKDVGRKHPGFDRSSVVAGGGGLHLGVLDSRYRLCGCQANMQISLLLPVPLTRVGRQTHRWS